MGKRLFAAVIVVFITGCAAGYADNNHAYGVALGNSEISACRQDEVDGCPKVEGGSISITAGGVITSIVSFLAGWFI